MRIFFSVGEPSGDLHASNLIRHLKSQKHTLTRDRSDDRSAGESPADFSCAVADGLTAIGNEEARNHSVEIECVGYGGPKMQAAGCELHFDLTTMAVMFIGQVLKHLRVFFRLIKEADDYFANHSVDAVVLIDYPGFNWWIARKAKKRGIPVFYYGVPQMWAWAPWRIRKIRKFVDHVLCKLPFEVKWFKDRNCNATYVGHPYFDQLHQQSFDENCLGELAADDRPLLTLLPGSRDQEVRSVLPVLLESASQVLEKFERCRVVVASYNQRQYEMALEMVRERGDAVEVMLDRTPELMRSADVCLACSGSVSMELMHYRKPTIIVFRVKRWVMWAQAFLLKTKFITLVNLIATDDIRRTRWRVFDPDEIGAEDAVMPEYLSTGDPTKTINAVAVRALKWLADDVSRNENSQRLNRLAERYAMPGATIRAAEYILNELGVEPINRPATVGDREPLGKKSINDDGVVRKTA